MTATPPEPASETPTTTASETPTGPGPHADSPIVQAVAPGYAFGGAAL